MATVSGEKENNPTVLFESDEYLVLDKPAGLVVHADGRTDERTLVDWLLMHYPTIEAVGEPLVLSDGRTIKRPGIVHRLDRETSGVLVVAKTQEMFAHLKRQFQDREVEKTYHALVYGEVKEERGVIDRPIGRSRSDFRKYSAQRGARGALREAVTEWEVLARGAGYTLLSLSPKTGRTHQLRVHLKAVNYPIVSDALYAPKREQALGMERLALHAHTLLFRNKEGERVVYTAPYPKDFERAAELLKR